MGNLTNDPQFAAQLIYPDFVVFGDEVRFSIEHTTFSLKHKVRSLSGERARETLTLNVNAEDVFELNIEKTTTLVNLMSGLTSTSAKLFDLSKDRGSRKFGRYR